jgi:Tfp pilus assembly protein PilN
LPFAFAKRYAFRVGQSLPSGFRDIYRKVITKLNLASQPFRNRTLPWTVAVVVSAVSLAALVYFFSQSSGARAEADVAEQQVERLRAEKRGVEEKAKQITQEIPEEERATLRAAHEIVDRKTFSWSQLFADLEQSLPTSVRVSRINVRDVQQRGGQTRAELDMAVVGRTPTDVTGMIAEMGRAGTFSAVPLTENQRSGKGESGYEWTLRVSYVQRARGQSRDGNDGAENVAAAARGGETDDRGRQ